jgi:hypothetical protein
VQSESGLWESGRVATQLKRLMSISQLEVEIDAFGGMS